MKILFTTILIFIVTIFPSVLKAQVTIGSGNPPTNGALLDLKEVDDAISIAGGRTASKGLIFPRVTLESTTSLNGISNADTTTPKRYAGLTVYNVTSNASLSEGVYVWDGTKWIGIQSQSPLKSFINVRGGSGTIVADVSISGLASWWRIPFPIEVFDENSEYDNISTYEFVPKQAGIYNIYAQYKIFGAVAAGEYSIGIIKRNANTSSYTVLAEETYSTVSVVGINVGSPVRSVETLVKLEAGDAIVIGVKTSVLNIVLIASANSYFTVHQVK